MCQRDLFKNYSYLIEILDAVCFFVLWHTNLLGLFNAKTILLEEKQWHYSTNSWKDKGVRTFPKGICPKVNVTVQSAYYNSALTITPRCQPGVSSWCNG